MNGARGTFDGFVSREGQIPDAELDAFWALLRPAGIDFMLGEWKGGEFQTGHKANGFMNRLNWFGKTFRSAAEAQPLVCLDADGNKFSNTEAMNGEASLWLEEFRGEVTATMVYDGRPVHDHFKVVDDNTVVGIMNGKGAVDLGSGAARYLYFYLQRVEGESNG
ncbi:DUF4334 domain-containing protein [Mycolicibacterium lutetiense]|uniref:DUF4334 domain-containing protein n=1 Tax=Mycolicibacterium lutetiense TaxID=1641992 RepID=A0ABS5A1C0_9MYCO|nr:DUF4334 domain-containing protein [Mycolicibacterium lutetiense]MBP2455549.1 hypothetical protein [Mycolicibacterium lutetiense]